MMTFRCIHKQEPIYFSSSQNFKTTWEKRMNQTSLPLNNHEIRTVITPGINYCSFYPTRNKIIYHRVYNNTMRPPLQPPSLTSVNHVCFVSTFFKFLNN